MTKKLQILKILYDTGSKLTATDFKMSNANQYLCTLEGMRLIEREWYKPPKGASFKLAFISVKTRTKAQKYLKLNSKSENLISALK